MGLSINELISLKSEQQRKTEEQWLTYQPDENQKDDPHFLKDKNNTLWYCQRDYAYKYFYVDNDIQKAKQAFYMCGRLIESATVKYDASLIDNAWNYFALALLSDNAELIKRYAKLTHSNFFNMVKLGWGSTYIYCMQCIINDDLEEYQKAIQIMKDKCIKKFKWGLDVEFLEALVLRNKDNCQMILQELVSKKGHAKRNKLETGYKDFISFPATTLAKLAWLKGVNVEVDTQLIPLALLPIQPNETYIDEYDFLKD